MKKYLTVIAVLFLVSGSTFATSDDMPNCYGEEGTFEFKDISFPENAPRLGVWYAKGGGNGVDLHQDAAFTDFWASNVTKFWSHKRKVLSVEQCVAIGLNRLNKDYIHTDHLKINNGVTIKTKDEQGNVTEYLLIRKL